MEYNEANQVKKVKECGNNQTIAEYVYDYDGNRMVKKVYRDGVLSKTVFSPRDDFEMEKIASTGATKNTVYYHVNGQLVGRKDGWGKRTYVHADHLGSTSVVTDSTEGVVEQTKYGPWGEIKRGGTKSKFAYTGQEHDGETGLNYYNARYYDPHLRRFTQPDDFIQDVYDPQMLNRYSYVRNNPLRYTDPTGEFIPALIMGAIMATPVIVNVVSRILTSPTAQRMGAAVINAARSAAPAIARYASSAGNAIANTARSAVGAIQSGASSAMNTAKNVASTVGNTVKSGGGSPSSQATTRGADSQKYITNNPQAGWKVGDPINNLTSKGNSPSWSTVRQRFWKNEGASDTPIRDWTGNVDRMRGGLAPQQNGRSLELDHWPAQRNGGLYEFNIIDREAHMLLEAERRALGLY